MVAADDLMKSLPSFVLHIELNVVPRKRPKKQKPRVQTKMSGSGTMAASG
jgi:hypothetical protein